MLADDNKKLSIFSYFLSKYDKDALNVLGYETYTEAFSSISLCFGKDNNYMKLRRDEFDAIVSNKRKGWRNRPPASGVLQIHDELKAFSFEQLTDIVKRLMTDSTINYEQVIFSQEEKKILSGFDEDDFERIINSTDASAKINRIISEHSVRVFDKTISNQLKQLYQYRCQICGATAQDMYCVDVSEAHHIHYFVKSLNNNANNIMILCPDHHRIIHKAQAVFDYSSHEIKYENGKVDHLLLNLHL